MASADKPIDDVPIPAYSREEMNVPEVRESLQKRLTQREFTVFEDWRIEFCRWAYDRGKNPRKFEGYSVNSMRDIVNRVERLCEWLYIGTEATRVSNDEDRDLDEVIANSEGRSFTIDFSRDHLRGFWYYLLQKGTRLDSCRRTINSASLVLKHRGLEWEIPDSDEVYEDIHKEESNAGFPDWFRGYELKKIKSASLRLDSVPDRDSMDEEEINQWAVHLSQRLEKPKYELEDDDWEVRSWKIPSLTYLSCDVGFRPCEIFASRIQWLDIEKEKEAYLRIPRDEDSKSGKRHRSCKISPETVRLLNYWIEERLELPEYEDTDAIWLNRDGNPYKKGTLRYLMIKLQREAGIDVKSRENGWYMIRRGVGTDIINKGSDITLLMQQLRINRTDTAQRYVQNADKAADDYFQNR